MKNLMHTLGTCLVLAFFTAAAAAQSSNGEADGLVKVKTRKVDQAWLLPGADFSSYKKVMIVPSEVAFQKNWLRDMNNRALSLTRRMSDKDAQKIVEAARSGFDDIWADAFKSAGYEVVTVAGPDVLKLVPIVFDLYINAPDVGTDVRSRTYSFEAGEASLSLDVRDSMSGTLLGRFIDERTAGRSAGRVEWRTSVSNRADFGQIFKHWAKLAAEGLGELALASPLSESLQPNQKLPKQ